MRAADPPVYYLVGTPKGRLTKLEQDLLALPWATVRPGVQVKLLAQEGDLLSAQSDLCAFQPSYPLRLRKFG